MTPHDDQAVQAMVEEIRAEFPSFRIVHKRDSALSVVIHHFLRVVTFGAQDSYLSSYHTVLGHTLYVPVAWDSTSSVDRVITLRHERVHLRQGRRYTYPVFALLYLLPLFPVGLAYFRARFEWEAYAETLLATAQLKGLAHARDPELRRAIVERFVGGDYGWMWPFPKTIDKWYDQALTRISHAMEDEAHADGA